MKQSMKALLLGGVAVLVATMSPLAHAEDSVFSGVTYGNGTITITHDGISITMHDKNVGATEVGYGSGASAPRTSYGTYYQWGGMTGYTVGMTIEQALASGFQTGWTSNGWTKEQEIQICGEGYHIPTSDEWQEVIDMYSSNGNNLGTFYKAFKVPFAGGFFSGKPYLASENERSIQWTTTPNSEKIADGFHVDSSNAWIASTNPNAHPIRCFKDSGSSTSTSATTEIKLTILEGALRLISNVSAITFNSITASLSNTGITASFNDFIEVEDLKGSSSGYYVTVNATDLVSNLASNASGTEYYKIPKSNLTFNPNSSTFKREGSDNAQVEVGEGNTFEGVGGFTYIYRANNTQAGILGKYGTKPSLTINVPANTPAATYSGKIIFTLFDGYSSH